MDESRMQLYTHQILRVGNSTTSHVLTCRATLCGNYYQRWSPRGHILKSLASKVKSLALRPRVLENWPVLGSRIALFFELLKFCGAIEKFFGKRFFVEIAWKIFVKIFFFFFGDCLKNFCEDLFFLESTCACVLGPWPWPRECLSSERLSLALNLASDFFCVLGLGLEPCVLDSTSDYYCCN